MDVQHSLIGSLMLYELFEAGHNAAMEATKNICSTKDEGKVDHSPSNQMDEEILLGSLEPWWSGKVR